MKWTIGWSAGLVAVALFGLLPSVRPADASSCVGAAAQELRDCKANCKEDFQVAKDACFNRDHACVEVCRAERYDCREASGIDADLAACRATRDAAIDNCKQLYDPGTPERDQCIDNAQVDAFSCRDQARESNRDELKACRQAFRACARACGPPDVPVNVPQCLLDAKAAALTCKAGCIEDFQFAKDTCHNRDHDCVEACRVGRETCRDNVGLDDAIASCNATRDAAVDDCRQLYGAGTPERDQCIDQVQVVAFECRDQAREDARPGLRQCRDDFRSCAQACPPPPGS